MTCEQAVIHRQAHKNDEGKKWDNLRSRCSSVSFHWSCTYSYHIRLFSFILNWVDRDSSPRSETSYKYILFYLHVNQLGNIPTKNYRSGKKRIAFACKAIYAFFRTSQEPISVRHGMKTSSIINGSYYLRFIFDVLDKRHSLPAQNTFKILNKNLANGVFRR